MQRMLKEGDNPIMMIEEPRDIDQPNGALKPSNKFHAYERSCM